MLVVSFVKDPDFQAWLQPRISPLKRARAYDLLHGDAELTAFKELLELLMEDFKFQAFANWPLDSGPPSTRLYGLAKRQLEIACDALICCPVPERTAPLEKGGGRELWAASHGQVREVREITCLEMGIPSCTPDGLLPPNFSSVRNNIVRRDFSMLSEDVQEQWIVSAREGREVNLKGTAPTATIQDFQEELPKWIQQTLTRKARSGSFGTTMVVQYSGLDQFSTFMCEKWLETDVYQKFISPLWTDFVQTRETIFDLPEFGSDVEDHALQPFRDQLKEFLEQLFIRQSGMDDLDETMFWTEIKRRPNAFVDPQRTPVDFANPNLMSDWEFRLLYDHVWNCRRVRASCPPFARFAYKAEALRDYPKAVGNKENLAPGDPVV
ncbi:hypothetical protein AURDEDRAFT_121231 [Auricularia subglabra TFB-10046 SS5]|nr:hypothetical protein AURDEDRAFT_121231 [Auricularia subglabra TFB-10046 SS5]